MLPVKMSRRRGQFQYVGGKIGTLISHRNRKGIVIVNCHVGVFFFEKVLSEGSIAVIRSPEIKGKDRVLRRDRLPVTPSSFWVDLHIDRAVLFIDRPLGSNARKVSLFIGMAMRPVHGRVIEYVGTKRSIGIRPDVAQCSREVGKTAIQGSSLGSLVGSDFRQVHSVFPLQIGWQVFRIGKNKSLRPRVIESFYLLGIIVGRKF